MDLQALRACKEAANSVKEATRKNTENANYNAEQDASWGGAHSAWQERQANFNNAHNDWVARLNSRIDNIKNEDIWAGRGGCGTNPGCPDGTHWNHNNNGFFCERVCRKNDDVATNQGNAEFGPSEPHFTEAEPIQNTNEYVHKGDVIPLVDVTCCANILNVIASNVSNTNITQVNDCSSKLDKQIKGKSTSDKSAEDKAADKSTADKAAADKAAADQAASNQAADQAAEKIISDKLDKLNKIKSKKRNTYIIIGILIFLLCCCSSSSIIGLFSFQDTGNDDYYN